MSTKTNDLKQEIKGILLDSKEKEKLFEELNKLDFNSKFLKVA